ncbi:hypothetical protein HK105_207799 [Polyrhizophydium stewartii]|uniref:Dipeptidylpeptidase IV N-terminal domain-containing protein n=1 Tax=Polyrhizophydium stewartii TaxID=2732419 RepID=A0ABR4MZS9_9FUNG
MLLVDETRALPGPAPRAFVLLPRPAAPIDAPRHPGPTAPHRRSDSGDLAAGPIDLADAPAQSVPDRDPDAAPTTIDLIWSSERSGFRHLYHISCSFAPHARHDASRVALPTSCSTRQITVGDWPVADAPLAVDLDRSLVYFSASRDSPLETHLHVACIHPDATLPVAPFVPLTQPAHIPAGSVSPPPRPAVDLLRSPFAQLLRLPEKPPSTPPLPTVSSRMSLRHLEHNVRRLTALGRSHTATVLPSLERIVSCSSTVRDPPSTVTLDLVFPPNEEPAPPSPEESAASTPLLFPPPSPLVFQKNRRQRQAAGSCSPEVIPSLRLPSPFPARSAPDSTTPSSLAASASAPGSVSGSLFSSFVPLSSSVSAPAFGQHWRQPSRSEGCETGASGSGNDDDDGFNDNDNDGESKASIASPGSSPVRFRLRIRPPTLPRKKKLGQAFHKKSIMLRSALLSTAAATQAESIQAYREVLEGQIFPTAVAAKADAAPNSPGSDAANTSADLTPQHSLAAFDVLPHPELFSFVNSDGIRLHGMLFKPLHHSDGHSCPVLVRIHGDPREQAVANEFKLPKLEDIFLALKFGYAVVVVDARGSRNRGVAFASGLGVQPGLTASPLAITASGSSTGKHDQWRPVYDRPRYDSAVDSSDYFSRAGPIVPSYALASMLEAPARYSQQPQHEQQQEQAFDAVALETVRLCDTIEALLHLATRGQLDLAKSVQQHQSAPGNDANSLDSMDALMDMYAWPDQVCGRSFEAPSSRASSSLASAAAAKKAALVSLWQNTKEEMMMGRYDGPVDLDRVAIDSFGAGAPTAIAALARFSAVFRASLLQSPVLDVNDCGSTTLPAVVVDDIKSLPRGKARLAVIRPPCDLPNGGSEAQARALTAVLESCGASHVSHILSESDDSAGDECDPRDDADALSFEWLQTRL